MLVFGQTIEGNKRNRYLFIKFANSIKTNA